MINISKGQIGFHESSILRATTQGTTIRFKMEGVLIERSFRDVEVHVENVEKITKNYLQVSSFIMESADSEILSLDERNGIVFLVLYWNFSSAPNPPPVAYEFKGPNVVLRLAHIGAVTTSYDQPDLDDS